MKKKRIKRISIAMGSILGFLLLVIRGFAIFEHTMNSDAYLEKKFGSYADGELIFSYEHEGLRTRYIIVGPQGSTPVILVHGSPGSISSRRQLIHNTDIAQRYRVYIPDRIGFGKSGKSRYYSIEEQTQALVPLLKTAAKDEPVYLIGYSLGGPHLIKLSSDYPELIAGQVHVASAVDPENEIIWMISHVIKYPPFRQILPDMLMVTVDEKFNHPRELEEMLPDWEQVTSPIAIMHGIKDRIVPVENSYFMQDHLVNASNIFTIIDDQQNHSLPFSKPWRIVEALDELVTAEIMAAQ